MVPQQQLQPPPRLLILPSAEPPAASAAAPGPSPLPPPPPPPRKRQRLAHLSPEEKALRRKLKNRVAAQSARDRKKARMGELERQAVELEAENQRLREENRRLREETHGLALENRELRLRLGLPALQCGTEAEREALLKVEMLEPKEEEEEGNGGEREEEEGAPACSAPASGSAESAAGTGPDDGPLGSPLGSPLLPPLDLDAEPDLLLGLLEGLDPEELFLGGRPLRDPPLPSSGGPEGPALRPPEGPPFGAGPPRLEAINELIRSDHEYTKPPLRCLRFLQEEEEEAAPLPPPPPSSEASDPEDLAGLLLFGGSYCEGPSEDAFGGRLDWELFPQLVAV